MGLTNIFVACVNGVTNMTCDMRRKASVLNWAQPLVGLQTSRITHVWLQTTFTFDEKKGLVVLVAHRSLLVTFFLPSGAEFNMRMGAATSRYA